MAAMHSLLSTDGDGQGAVHFQQTDGGASRGGESLHSRSVPDKMVLPGLIAGMKEGHCFSSERIAGEAARTFAEGTRDAGECRILQYGPTALRDRMNMIHMKGRLLSSLRQTTVLAAVSRTAGDFLPQPCRHAHAMRRPGFRVRSFSSDRNSAISTSPSASKRSAADKG
jgi:hypothetical protein